MSVWSRAALCAATLVLAGLTSESAANYVGAYYGWSEHISADRSTWAGYFRRNARIELGPERRLPNGVSWRLLTDRLTGVPTPRVTWMPNRERLLAANRLLDMVQGGDMMVVKEEERRLNELNHYRVKEMGAPALDQRPVFAWDVELTYVGARLMSMVANASTWGEGRYSTYRLQRGLVFDLQAGTMAHVGACPGGSEVYGFRPDYSPETPERFVFRYGELLDLCDPARYRDFIAVLKQAEARGRYRHLDPSPIYKSDACIEYPEIPVFQEKQEYILYLTFSGLAVQATGRHCPLQRTPDNPVVIPYRDLAPFMLPGPWQEELLSLQ